MNHRQIIRLFYTILAALLLAACGEPAADAPAAAEPAFKAAAEFAALSGAEDTTAEDWYALAQRARMAGDLGTAAEALEVAATELSPVRLALERNRIRVLQGDADAAITSLRGLFDSGFTNVNAISADAVLASLAGNPEFDGLIDEMSRQAFPCEYDDKFTEFDFWLGSWDVHIASGQLVGSNRIERAERGCVLTEHWTNAAGGTGMSINYVDKTTDEWVQIWNAAGGTQIDIRGGLTDDGMRLIGKIHYVANGTTADFRGLWAPLPDGRVRQFFEQSNDGGESWAPWFEGFYTRKSANGNSK